MSFKRFLDADNNGIIDLGFDSDTQKLFMKTNRNRDKLLSPKELDRRTQKFITKMCDTAARVDNQCFWLGTSPQQK
jgi:hypothetical protein